MRVVVPLDPSRYLELPWAIERLGARPGERVLDLASPKLLAVVLVRRGVRVTSVDQLEREIETWRALAGDVNGLELQVADGRALPFEDESFDHAYSISVLEHIEEPGDAEALRELARVVRPAGRVLVTLPHAQAFREDWRDAPVYANQPSRGRSFFQRWYDPLAHRRAGGCCAGARARVARGRAHAAELERRLCAVVPVARAAGAGLRIAGPRGRSCRRRRRPSGVRQALAASRYTRSWAWAHASPREASCRARALARRVGRRARGGSPLPCPRETAGRSTRPHRRIPPAARWRSRRPQGSHTPSPRGAVARSPRTGWGRRGRRRCGTARRARSERRDRATPRRPAAGRVHVPAPSGRAATPAALAVRARMPRTSARGSCAASGWRGRGETAHAASRPG